MRAQHASHAPTYVPGERVFGVAGVGVGAGGVAGLGAAVTRGHQPANAPPATIAAAAASQANRAVITRRSMPPASHEADG
jgi:hypothetical protein